MSQAFEYSIAIPLSDGRTVIAAPRPEDKDRLELMGQQTLTIGPSVDYDTAGHGFGSDVMVDVEGHAMTLRLPTPADAEALRRALAAGAITATIVAAGVIASMQGNTGAPAAPAAGADPAVSRPATTQVFQPGFLTEDAELHSTALTGTGSEGTGALAPVRPDVNTSGPLQVPQAQPDFQNRKDAQTDQMLAAPPMQAAPSDVQDVREFTQGPGAGSASESSSGAPGQPAAGASESDAQMTEDGDIGMMDQPATEAAEDFQNNR
jgi:hypothetical protein